MNENESQIFSINVHSDINELFAKTTIEIPINNGLKQFALPISENAYVNDIMISYQDKTYSLEDIRKSSKLPAVEVYIDNDQPYLLKFKIAGMSSSENFQLKIITYEILENKLGIYNYIIPNKLLSLQSSFGSNQHEILRFIDKEHLFRHEISIKSEYALEMLSTPKFLDVQNLGDSHLMLKSKSDEPCQERYLSIRYIMMDKPNAQLYTSKNGDAYPFILEHSYINPHSAEKKLNEIFLIVDLSEGMTQKQTDMQKEIIKKILKNIRSTDKINMLVYTSKYFIFSSHSVFADSNNISQLFDFYYDFTSYGIADIEKIFQYAAIVPIPLGYSRNYILLSSNSHYPMKDIESISNSILSSRCFMLLFDSIHNIRFASAIAAKHIGDHFIINDSYDIDLFTKNMYSVIETELITEIDFDFGEAEISRIVDSQSAAIPLYKTFYISGETNKPISELPSIRSLISDKVIDTKCEHIIEINDDILGTFTNTNGFKSQNPIIRTIENRKQTISKDKHLFFDDTDVKNSNLVISCAHANAGFYHAVFCESEKIIEYVSNAISQNKSAFEKIFLNFTKKLFSKELLTSFQLNNNKIECNAIILSQIEYNTNLRDELERDLSKLLTDIIIKDGSSVGYECKMILEYK